MVHANALARQQNPQLAPAKATAHPRQLAQARVDSLIIRSTTRARSTPIALHARRWLTHTRAQVRRSLPLRCGRHHFFEAMYFSMALSSIVSASSLLSRRFSSSSERSRLASGTSGPPYPSKNGYRSAGASAGSGLG